MNNLEQEVITWARTRGIFAKSDPKSQMLKTVEEVGELADGIGKGDKAEIADAIGDIAVTLILQAKMQGLSFTECLDGALTIISQRKGRMVGGMFVKDE